MTPSELDKIRARYGVSETVARLSLSDPAPTLAEPSKPAPSLFLRQSRAESDLNKTEQRYLAWLRGQQNKWIGIQCITLKLVHDCRFTPDFWALDEQGLRAIDTKAFSKSRQKPLIEDDALVKIKVAARLYPFIRFVIAWEEGLIWLHREIPA